MIKYKYNFYKTSIMRRYDTDYNCTAIVLRALLFFEYKNLIRLATDEFKMLVQ